MRALVYSAAWELSLQERAEPAAPVRDEVLVRVRATGICGTDLGIIGGEYAARPGVVLGHESSGEVVAVGPAVRDVQVGDRVVIDPTFFCGQCRLCRSGRQNHCERKGETETGVSADGTMAPLHKTTERFLYTLPAHVGFEEASLTEPLSCAVTGANQLRLRPSLRAVVLGGGPMGVLYAWVLSSLGLTGTLVERAPGRRELCREVVDRRWAVAESLDEVCARYARDAAPLDVVVDTTGRMAGDVLPKLSRGGQVLLVGLKRHEVPLDVGAIADRSLSVQGSIDSLDGSFATALHLIGSGVIPARRLVSHQLPLTRFREGLALVGCDVDARRQGAPAGALKVVLQP
ncbi:zinc-dependent alcohol dehydrogenase [Myxococcus faecalis]|uniref:zinc-dependent alcohol dehydrogenase n=1 Tax=Myxococcus faecalis TaxID=3115646 RepID=UPI003CEA10C1